MLRALDAPTASVEVVTVLIRRLARPMLASIFIKGGVDTLLNPEPRVQTAAPLVDKVGSALPDQVPTEPGQLVRIDAGVKIAAGSMLALGRFPRLSSLLLAGTLVPTTVAGHAFWERADPAQRFADEQQFLKNLSILGGLVLAAVDTEGRPSLGWRARRTARKVSAQTQDLTGQSPSAADSVRSAAESARTTVRDGVDTAIGYVAA